MRNPCKILNSNQDSFSAATSITRIIGRPARPSISTLFLYILLFYFQTPTRSHPASGKFEPTTLSERTAIVTPSLHPNRRDLYQLRGGAQSDSQGKRAFSLARLAISRRETKQQVQQLDSLATDHIQNRTTMLIRLLFLTYYGSLGSLMPYLPVYYHSLGHGGQIIGMLGAVKPLTTFVVAPLWGLISDKLQKPFLILQVTFLVSLVGQLLVGARHDPWYIMFMVFITALFNAPVKSLIDSMVMGTLEDQSSYGRLRLWGQMGFGLGSSGVGLLLARSKEVGWLETTNVFSPKFEDFLQQSPPILRRIAEFMDKFWQSLTGYKLLFATYLALSIPTWFCIQAFRRDTTSRESKATKERKPQSDKEASSGAQVGAGLRMLLSNADALIFFFLVFVVGVSSGCIENFAYVRMREVGGTGKEMGLSRLVSSLAGAPMFWYSGPLTKALGADRVIVLSLMSYVLRFIIYAGMRNAYYGLPAEALRGVTFAAFWSTCTIYAHKVSPPGLHATMLMFLNAMYGGLGQSLGAIIGGKLQYRFGTVKTFLYSAAFDFAFVCFILVYLSLRKSSNFRDPQPIERIPKSKEK